MALRLFVLAGVRKLGQSPAVTLNRACCCFVHSHGTRAAERRQEEEQGKKKLDTETTTRKTKLKAKLSPVTAGQRLQAPLTKPVG